jgi:threonine/homoserine/homoserine lactone efflux protein
VAGVFSGSAAWWLGLSAFFSLFRRHLTPVAMTWINRLSGAVLTLFGALVLFEIVV